MLKRQMQPTLADIGKAEQIQFERHERIDVRGLLTSQQEPGVNLFFYDWNNSGKPEGRERPPASRSGKRNTNTNFFKHADRTPKSKVRGGEGLEKKGEPERGESGGEKSPVSSR